MFKACSSHVRGYEHFSKTQCWCFKVYRLDKKRLDDVQGMFEPCSGLRTFLQCPGIVVQGLAFGKKRLEDVQGCSSVVLGFEHFSKTQCWCFKVYRLDKKRLEDVQGMFEPCSGLRTFLKCPVTVLQGLKFGKKYF